MKVEVLVATMHQKDHSLVEKMNIQTDAVVINQCDKDSYEEFEHNGKRIKFISNTQRGLSRSRNLAIESSDGDICVIADDDIVYEKNYREMIQKAYEDIPQADIIVFEVPLISKINEKKFGDKAFKMGFKQSLRVASYRITFRRKSIIENGIKFLNVFGAGSIYNHGEENIFIKDCRGKGLQVYYYPYQIAINHQGETTWFKGYDEKYFFDIGAIYYELFNNLYLPFGIRLLFRRRKKLKGITFLSGIKAIMAGKKEYKDKNEEENA